MEYVKINKETLKWISKNLVGRTEKVEDWRTNWCRTKTEKQRGMPEKYTYDDWNLGHYIKEKKNNGRELLL